MGRDRYLSRQEQMARLRAAQENATPSVVGEMWENRGDLLNEEPRNPADNPVPAYNCPTGTCGTDKVCAEIVEGDTIDPNGRAHIERNACNKCPSSPPVAIYIMEREYHNSLDYIEYPVLDHYADSSGRVWSPDNSFTAPIFHGDAGLGNREPESMTFRLENGLSSDERGWQCRYHHGVLDDTSTDMGTYDYAEAPSPNHTAMDVDPHLANPNYAPNLTEQY